MLLKMQQLYFSTVSSFKIQHLHYLHSFFYIIQLFPDPSLAMAVKGTFNYMTVHFDKIKKVLTYRISYVANDRRNTRKCCMFESVLIVATLYLVVLKTDFSYT